MTLYQSPEAFFNEAPNMSVFFSPYMNYISYDEDKLYVDLKTIFIDVDDFVWILNS